MAKFTGSIMCFSKNGEGDETNSDDAIVEVTMRKLDGTVEVAFDDRNERCYLSFKLQDLIQAVCATEHD